MLVPTSTSAAALPAIATGFVRKLYRLLDQENAAIIRWSASGASFVILDDEQLNEVVLPRYFRGRLCAFRQQLREHGFQQKIGAVTSSVSHVAPLDGAQCTYFHEHFVRGYPGLLSKITRTPLPRRRISNRKTKAALAAKRSAAKAGLQESAQQELKRANIKSEVVQPSASVPAMSTSSTATTVASTCALSLSSGSACSSSLSTSTNAPPAAPASIKKNPLFSDESDSLFGDWFMTPTAGTTGCSAADPIAATTDIAFSEDMLGALMNLVTNSMSATSCGAASGVPETCKSNVCLRGPSSAAATSASAKASGLYETHQFSDDTINSMMVWLGSSSTTT
ncbi:Transcription factor skn7, partial [Globisporangium splendens]